MSRWLERGPVVPEICAALSQERVEYLVIGGIAGILHGNVRVATDLDILISRTRDNATRVLLALAGTGYGFASEWLPAEILKAAITVIGDDPSVNIFTVIQGLRYEEALPRANSADADGVRIPFLGLEDLITTKRTGRKLDGADIERLERIRTLRDR